MDCSVPGGISSSSSNNNFKTSSSEDVFQSILYKLHYSSRNSAAAGTLRNNLADEFFDLLSKYHQRDAHSLQEMRIRNDKKIHGDIFEEFAKIYMQKEMKISNVWLLKEVPDEVLEYLKLKRNDVGIDIIGLDDDGFFYACQAKYKDRSKRVRGRKVSVTWKEASTFFALSARTGPYRKYIIITTADYVRHMAPKTKSDISICLGTLRRLTKESFLSFCRPELFQPPRHLIKKDDSPPPSPPLQWVPSGVPSSHQSQENQSDFDIMQRQNREYEEALEIDRQSRAADMSEKEEILPKIMETTNVCNSAAVAAGGGDREEKTFFIREARLAYFEKMRILRLEQRQENEC